MGAESLILALKCDLGPFRKALGEAKGAAKIAGTDILKATSVSPDVSGIKSAEAKLKELGKEAKLLRDVLSEALQGKGGGINTSELQKELDKAGLAFRKLDSNIKIAKAEMNEPLNKMAASWGKLSMAIGGGLIALGVGAFESAKKLGEEAEAMKNLSEKTGIHLKSLAELSFVASQSGLEISSVGNGIAMLERKLFGLEDGSSKASAAIKQLGVKTTDTKGQLLPMGQIFDNTVRALRNVENVTQRNTLAAQIFGKGFGELVPILAMTRKEYDAIVASGYKAGAIFTQASFDQALGVEDLMHTFNAYMRGLQISMMEAITPALQAIAPLITDLVKGIAWLAGQIGYVFSGKNTLVTWLAGFISAAPTMILWAVKISTAIKGVGSVSAAVGGFLSGLMGNWKAILAGLAVAAAAGGVFALAMNKLNKDYEDEQKKNEAKYGNGNTTDEAKKALEALNKVIDFDPEQMVAEGNAAAGKMPKIKGATSEPSQTSTNGGFPASNLITSVPLQNKLTTSLDTLSKAINTQMPKMAEAWSNANSQNKIIDFKSPADIILARMLKVLGIPNPDTTKPSYVPKTTGWTKVTEVPAEKPWKYDPHRPSPWAKATSQPNPISAVAATAHRLNNAVEIRSPELTALSIYAKELTTHAYSMAINLININRKITGLHA